MYFMSQNVFVHLERMKIGFLKGLNIKEKMIHGNDRYISQISIIQCVHAPKSDRCHIEKETESGFEGSFSVNI